MLDTKFPEVTLLITHYNRSKSLERLLDAFARLNIAFGDIVVSDDSSRIEHLTVLEKLQHKYEFRLISTPTNHGLGNNLNKGQDAVITPYTLYVQEDFVPTKDFTPQFRDAFALMHDDTGLDIVKFYAYYAYPYLKTYTDYFSEMIYSPWFIDTSKIYQYSDHPHLRRSNFLDKFGRYREDIKSDKAEYLMCISFLQSKGRGIFYNNFTQLFTQENSADEPSTVIRSDWKQSRNIAITSIRALYRLIKYNYDIHLSNPIRKIRIQQ